MEVVNGDVVIRVFMIIGVVELVLITVEDEIIDLLNLRNTDRLVNLRFLLVMVKVSVCIRGMGSKHLEEQKVVFFVYSVL